MKRLLIITLFSFSIGDFYGQEFLSPLDGVYGAGVNLTKKLGEKTELKVAYEFRTFGGIDPFGLSTNRRRDDISLGLEHKVANKVKAAVGGMNRFSNRINKQRLFQQIGAIQKLGAKWKLAHRFRQDETFSTEPTEYRTRYRLGVEIPKSGLRLDKGENYFVFSSEILNQVKGGEYSLELRITQKLGYLFFNDNKGEFQIEYRIDDLLGSPERLLFLTIAYYMSK